MGVGVTEGGPARRLKPTGATSRTFRRACRSPLPMDMNPTPGYSNARNRGLELG